MQGIEMTMTWGDLAEADVMHSLREVSSVVVGLRNQTEGLNRSWTSLRKFCSLLVERSRYEKMVWKSKGSYSFRSRDIGRGVFAVVAGEEPHATAVERLHNPSSGHGGHSGHCNRSRE